MSKPRITKMHGRWVVKYPGPVWRPVIEAVCYARKLNGFQRKMPGWVGPNYIPLTGEFIYQ